MERWLAALNSQDRVVTCAIVRGEILFGIARMPRGQRRSELEGTASALLSAFHCEPVPGAAGDHYAEIKRSRQSSGLALDENDLWIAATALAIGATLVSRDRDFAGIANLQIVTPRYV